MTMALSEEQVYALREWIEAKIKLHIAEAFGRDALSESIREREALADAERILRELD
jgi:hypothetical protein